MEVYLNKKSMNKKKHTRGCFLFLGEYIFFQTIVSDYWPVWTIISNKTKRETHYNTQSIILLEILYYKLNYKIYISLIVTSSDSPRSRCILIIPFRRHRKQAFFYKKEIIDNQTRQK